MVPRAPTRKQNPIKTERALSNLKLFTTQPHSEGGSIFAYKGVGHEVTPLQASDKFHVFQPRFLTVNPQNSTLFLDTFWIHFTYKGVENGNPLISEKATPLRARLCSTD
ncbi:Hypothetical_protein [Hexamita inflata]|uniref:Hypothetical_protein n=1 Tax=Hexamita inflata TaxID=28002 RepID=A0AA86NC08_9EUKA|nr:Hypothetical protein HINF_LOCUS4507 [Hexamita inflata]CAI9964693.1 Hypothetical protein HINF_LOCUS52338 [Hexamita inflata]